MSPRCFIHQITRSLLAIVLLCGGFALTLSAADKTKETESTASLEQQLKGAKIAYELDSDDQITSVTIGHKDAPISVGTLKLIGKIKTLKSIRSEAAFDNVSTEELAAIGAIKSLESLSLDSCDFQGSDLKKLSTLPKLTTIQFVDSTLDDHAAKGISTIKTLTVLKLNGNQISDAGLKALTNLKELQELNLAKNREDRLKPSAGTITDAGLVSLKGLKQLKALNLSGNQITDGALKTLSTLKTLEALKLANTKMSAEAVAKLQQSLPDCKIETKD